jgi:DNA-binding ferritin-like protein
VQINGVQMDTKTQTEIKELMKRIKKDYDQLLTLMEREVNLIPDDWDETEPLQIDTTRKSKEIITIRKW